ncbi:hypothetical protein FISHEDRAFT_78863 [Fistulina hepatica ATCC 64428]|uniref:DNA/RNA polymerase n=1 Tax=Fistulina hepatica ATCC 64428 TaxID=1128425 RepID=A0A0D6ZZX6_9AGAR|nr:hypothetical protein FISHEDRAFT_78863 [Fistulina hepatica ATCC 64428]
MSSSHEASAEPQSPVGIQTEAITACESVVDRFRAGEISKARAIVEIQRHIPYSGDYDNEEELTSHSKAIESFLQKLDGFERIRGTAGAPDSGREVGESTLGRDGSAADERQQEEISAGSHKRLRGESDDEEEEDGASGKSRFDLACLPWNSRKQPRMAETSTFYPAPIGTEARISSISRTVEILEAINIDLKRARTNLLLSFGAPQFPESQWTKLLSGGTADFDQVLSGLYASADVERTTERIGGLELSYIATTPTKKVTTFGDWTTAYDSFTEAFLFVFPHRREEMCHYAMHVKAFFKARPVSEHSGVIAYNSAVRTRVGHRHELLHTDFLEFQDLQIQFIFSPIGSAGGALSRGVESSGSPNQRSHAITRTSAASVEQEAMWRKVVRRSKEFLSRYAPKYARNLVWYDDTEDDSPPSKQSLAETSLTARPVPAPPANELSNCVALTTISKFPHLFSIVTPVNVDRFECLLRNHPNFALVQSVCRSLRGGFWPWASTAQRAYPTTYDNSEGYRTLTDPIQLAFARRQCAAEVAAGRFSESFGPDLLPGMYAVPMWVVPKPHSNGLRLVVDHSAGQFSLNSMIPRAERSVHLDGLQQLGEALISAREHHPNRPLVVWKSDVSHAYRILPMHPLWQIKQTVVLDAQRRVDFDNDFGGGGSGRIWSIFFSLVLWIATFVKYILDLFAYVDDTFSWDFADCLLWYEPYQDWFPSKQVKLLRLWDDLRIPHERKKQEWGHSLTIIGFLVDTDEMTITMPDQSRRDLIVALRAFAIPKRRRPLVEFQRLAGWVNWSLNVYTMLRPGLNMLYAKIRNKTQPLQSLWVSKVLCGELLWVANHLESSEGVRILRSRQWTNSQVSLVVFTDACLSGMSFYVPSTSLGFQCSTDVVSLPRGVSQDRILYFEALAVVSAIVHLLAAPPYPKRIIVRTDNTNTVDMFNSLHALPPYNPLLITTVDRLMQTGCELRVLHLPGVQNTIADALSRFHNHYATALSPRMQISSFSPPRLSSGVTVT